MNGLAVSMIKRPCFVNFQKRRRHTGHGVSKEGGEVEEHLVAEGDGHIVGTDDVGEQRRSRRHHDGCNKVLYALS